MAIKRNEIGSFVETWMDIETVTQSEVSQKEKNMADSCEYMGKNTTILYSSLQFK